MKEIVNRLHENRQIQLAKEILESNGYKVEKSDNLNEIVSESSYKDPIRVKIKINTGDAKFKKDYDLEKGITNSIKSVSLRPDILVDESDRSYQIVFPGKSDWLDAVTDMLKYNISSKITVETEE